MKLLKQLFPISFKYKDSVASLIIGILIYVVGAAIAGALLGLLPDLPIIKWVANLPLISWLLRTIGSLLGTYSTAGIVIQVLAFLKILK